jgi:hypothetical protein
MLNAEYNDQVQEYSFSTGRYRAAEQQQGAEF